MYVKKLRILVVRTGIALCFLSMYIGNAQGENRKKVDSLLTVYQAIQPIESKVEILDDIIDLLIYNDSEKAKVYIQEMRRISADQKYEHGILQGDFNLGYHYFNLQQMDSAKFYFDKTLVKSKIDNDDSFVRSTLKNLSILYAHEGNYAKAIQLMDSVAQISLVDRDYLRYGSALSDTGVHYYEMGNYPKAMTFYKKALETYDTLEINTYHKADLFRNLGKLHNVQSNHSSALSYFEKAVTVYRALGDNMFLANTLSDMGSVYSFKRQHNKAIEKYKECLETAIANNFPSAEIIAYGNLGSEYLTMGQNEAAIAFLEKALEMGQRTSADNNLVTDMSNLGLAYTNNNDFNKGLGLLNLAVSKADAIGITNELQSALLNRAVAYEKNGMPLKAIADYKRSRMINDSLFSITKTKQINELQTIYETEKKEAEIALQQEEINTLNEKVKVDRLTRGLFAGGMFTFVAISGLLFFGFRQRIKKNRIAREKQEEIYKQEIEHKQKELASQTLHLVQKNTFIQELMRNLEKIKKSPETFKMEFRRIVMLLKKENASDKDWEVFKTYFADVHNDFDQKLKTLYSEISEKEIRLAAFLRMNLTTKEIAATLNVLPDSILKSKYRLKKKLGLAKATDLTGFLNTL
ncbi:MAG: tetratricopeptide repeat protein [Bacteroidota bacterium]